MPDPHAHSKDVAAAESQAPAHVKKRWMPRYVAEKMQQNIDHDNRSDGVVRGGGGGSTRWLADQEIWPFEWSQMSALVVQDLAVQPPILPLRDTTSHHGRPDPVLQIGHRMSRNQCRALSAPLPLSRYASPHSIGHHLSPKETKGYRVGEYDVTLTVYMNAAVWIAKDQANRSAAAAAATASQCIVAADDEDDHTQDTTQPFKDKQKNEKKTKKMKKSHGVSDFEATSRCEVVCVAALINDSEVRMYRNPDVKYMFNTGEAMLNPHLNWFLPSSGWVSQLRTLLDGARWIYLWDSDEQYGALRSLIRFEQPIARWNLKTRDVRTVIMFAAKHVSLPVDMTARLAERLHDTRSPMYLTFYPLMSFLADNHMSGEEGRDYVFARYLRERDFHSAEVVAMANLHLVTRVCRMCATEEVTVRLAISVDAIPYVLGRRHHPDASHGVTSNKEQQRRQRGGVATSRVATGDAGASAVRGSSSILHHLGLMKPIDGMVSATGIRKRQPLLLGADDENKSESVGSPPRVSIVDVVSSPHVFATGDTTTTTTRTMSARAHTGYTPRARRKPPKTLATGVRVWWQSESLEGVLGSI